MTEAGGLAGCSTHILWVLGGRWGETHRAEVHSLSLLLPSGLGCVGRAGSRYRCRRLPSQQQWQRHNSSNSSTDTDTYTNRVDHPQCTSCCGELQLTMQRNDWLVSSPRVGQTIVGKHCPPDPRASDAKEGNLPVADLLTDARSSAHSNLISRYVPSPFLALRPPCFVCVMSGTAVPLGNHLRHNLTIPRPGTCAAPCLDLGPCAAEVP